MTGSFVRREIGAMRGYVPGEQPQGGKFIKLNTNENPYPPSEKAIAAIQHAAMAGLARYPDPLGDAFRIQAATLWSLDKDWILCGNGSDDLLTIVTRAFVGAGERLRLPFPSYVLYESLAEIQGAVSEVVPFARDWTLTETFAAAGPSGDLRLVFLPNPNSPSGTCIPPAEILRLAERLPCPLIVDEAYADFAETHCVPLVAQCEKILVTRTLSKAYSLAGLRFGYLIGQPHLVRELQKVKDSYNCDSLSIAGATAALADQDWLRDNRQKIVATRTQLTTQLGQLGFSVQSSQANFVWCQHATHPARRLYEQLKQEQILVRYMDYPGWGDGLRITVGTDEQVAALLLVLHGLLT